MFNNVKIIMGIFKMKIRSRIPEKEKKYKGKNQCNDLRLVKIFIVVAD